MKGKCKWFNATKGFGFLVSDGVEQDIFVHFSAIEMEGFKTLKEGEEVEFDLLEHERGPQASNVRRAA